MAISGIGANEALRASLESLNQAAPAAANVGSAGRLVAVPVLARATQQGDVVYASVTQPPQQATRVTLSDLSKPEDAAKNVGTGGELVSVPLLSRQTQLGDKVYDGITQAPQSATVATLSDLSKPQKAAANVGVGGELTDVPVLDRRSQEADAVYLQRGQGSALPTIAATIPPQVQAAA